ATSLLLGELVERARRRGDTVYVVQGNPDYRPTSEPTWRFGKLWQRTDAGVMVRSTKRGRNRIRSRLANYSSFLALSTPLAARRADCYLVMSDPPLLVVAGVAIAKLRRRPVVYWIQDYHPEFLLHTGTLKKSVLVRVWARMHTAAMRRCDLVVAIGRDMA